jgi:hypothetical protein
VTSYEPSAAWDEKVDEWIDGVVEELRLWNPNMVRRFKRVSLLESYGYGYDYMVVEYRKLVELEARCSQLRRIVFTEERATLRFSKLFKV